MTDYKTQDLPDGPVTILQATDILMVTRDPSGTPTDYYVEVEDFAIKKNFTPVITGTTAAGAGTYSAQLGRSSQIGDVVFFKIALVWTGHTGTGNMTITGLPTTSAGDSIVGISAGRWGNITLPAIGDKVLAYIGASGTTITLNSIASGAPAALAMDAAGSIYLTAFYFV